MPATRDGISAWIISDYSKWKRHKIRGLIYGGAELSDPEGQSSPRQLSRATVSNGAVTRAGGGQLFPVRAHVGARLGIRSNP